MDMCFVMDKEVKGYRVCSLLQKARKAVNLALIGMRVFVVLEKHLGLTHL